MSTFDLKTDLDAVSAALVARGYKLVSSEPWAFEGPHGHVQIVANEPWDTQRSLAVIRLLFDRHGATVFLRQVQGIPRMIEVGATADTFVAIISDALEDPYG